ncbi:hypothetical protein A2160_02225 [Candidatus Beckwithbacteria bacterium RBG_13_42_9]|uniref:Purine nucleoside phosphorylase n=1 Tax=Candidatus Beckwithbacteria bacterium RBG_13_42_9 TaxID=1797457 RepID=A0A1F5E7J0_9BACT|nr:MAG: hypothetical protein A2160_02225 [Candidatus Beckwithbacteria bacterium RBG_13_42_9]
MLEPIRVLFSKSLIQATFPKDFGNGGHDQGLPEENLIKKVEKFTQINRHNFWYCQQVHGTKVAKIEGKKLKSDKNIFPKTDAMITNLKRAVLVVRHADCIPIFLFDPKKEAIGIAHSGWRGTVGKIGLVTLLKMITEFDCRIDDLIVGLGPAAQVCCYRKSKNSIFKQLPEWQEFIKEDGKDITIDMSSFIKDMFLKAGVKKDNLKVNHDCTICDQDYFSWTRQRDRGKTEMRNMSIIALTENR